MSLSLAIFVILSALCLGGGLAVVTSSNIAYATISLMVSLVAVAGLYALLLAEFLALVQILIYGGAIVIVLLFALMLTRIQEFNNIVDNRQKPLAIIASLFLFVALALALVRGEPQAETRVGSTLSMLGTELFTSWVIAFEVAGVLLLIVLLGVVIITHREGE